MPRARTTAPLSSVASPEVAVRVHFGLSQQQLAHWLGLAPDFVGAIEKGRRPLPAALVPRLLVLARHLPPPLGSGPPALPPLPPEPPTVAATRLAALPARYPVPDPLGTPAPGPLHAAARAARLRALVAEKALLRHHARALELAYRRRGVAALYALPPPDPATAPAEAARWPTWLAEVAADLAAADPHPARVAAARHVLAVRAAAAYAEAAALAAAAEATAETGG